MTPIPAQLAAALADRYRLEREIGVGGMATVFLAHDLRHERKVAVKVLRPDLAATLGPDRFLQEIRIAAGLQHPHILPVHDSGQAGGYLFYVMPFIEGSSLAQKLAQEGALPIQDAVRILRDVADALAYAHRQGFVHRDIKPENVLISDRHALVADFGVAKAVGRATRPGGLTAGGLAVGTPTYMAPEQASAEPHIDHRADIYAFGVLAYEVLAGRPPFLGLAGASVAVAHLTQPPEPIERHRPDVPPALAALVMRCLEKLPAERWQSSEELVTRLEALFTPARGTVVTQAPAPRRQPRVRWRWLAGAGAALVTIALSVVLGTRRPRPPALDGQRLLIVPFADATGDPAWEGLAGLLETRLQEGMQRTGLVEVITRQGVALRLRRGLPANPAAVPEAQRLAEAIGAGLLLVGRYTVAGDSLQVEATLLDLSARAEPVSIPAIRTPRTNPEQGLDRLTARVMGSLAVTTDPRWGLRSVPGLVAPTFESYREYQLGNEAFIELRYRESVDHFRRAFEMDSIFFPYLIRAAYVLNNAGDPRGVDSIGALLAPRLSRLSEYDRYYLERVLAWNRGDFEAALRAARAMSAVAPKSVFAAYTAARSALHANRPVEALAGLHHLQVPSEEVLVDDYYGDLTWAYHLLGRYDEEDQAILAWGRSPLLARAISQHAVRLRVAAAQGWTDSVPAILGRMTAARPSPGAQLDGLLLVAAREFRWHGHPEAAALIADEVLRQGAGQPPSISRVEALTTVGRLDGAIAALDSVKRAHGPSWQLTGGSGALAAIRGGRTTAEISERRLRGLDEPYLWGRDKVWRARILAQLGDRAGAIALLRQASIEGTTIGSYHADPFLEPLRDDPAFKELVEPRG